MRNEHFGPLDGMRGVAILLVILVHSFSYKGPSLIGRGLEAVARAGWVGVTLFFVLSGFLITGILLDTRGRKNYLRDFWARRSLRIFPLYFGFLAIYFFVAPHAPFASEYLPQPGARVYYLTYLTNMKEWLSGSADQVAPLAPLWSLAVEEQVYLFWPFLILATPGRWLPAVLGGLALFSFGWRFVTRLGAQPVELSYAWAPANLESFAAGAMVAWASRQSGEALRAWAPRLATASGFFVLGMCAGQRHFNFWYAPVPMLTAGTTGLILFCAATIGYSVTAGAGSLLNRALSAPWLRLIGKYSYAIYLFHASVIDLLSPVVFSRRTGLASGASVPGALLFAGAVGACSFGLACLSWHAWERQFLRLKRCFPLTGVVVRPGAEGAGSKPQAGPGETKQAAAVG